MLKTKTQGRLLKTLTSCILHPIQLKLNEVLLLLFHYFKKIEIFRNRL